MNKTVIINVGGIVFHVEENAYDNLLVYLEELKGHFNATDGGHEIIADIENRMAEMFTEILKKSGKEVITDVDVEEVTRAIGSPSDFDQEFDDEEVETKNTNRRLFRNKDGQVLGGVCGGLAAYFAINVVWVRVAFVLGTLIFGSAVYLYLILWAIIPSAKTRIEKLQMKGEKINLENLKKSAAEDFDHIKRNVNKGMKHGTSFFGQFGDFVSNILQLLIEFIRRVLGLLGPIIGGFLLFFSLCALIGLMVGSGIFLNYFYSAESFIYPFDLFGSVNGPAAISTAVTLMVIPLISILILGIQLVFGIKIFTRYVFLGLLVVWMVAVVSGIKIGTSFGLDFAEEGEIRMVDEYETPLSSYYVSVGNDFQGARNFSLKNNGSTINFNDYNDGPKRARLRVTKSSDNKMYIVKNYSASGKTMEIALERADDIEYKYEVVDNKITFDFLFDVPEETPLRNQDLVINLQAPVGTELIFDNNIKEMYSYMYHYDCSEYLNGLKVKRLVMTENGLKCLDEPKEELDESDDD
ncbi:MAG: phage shock protein PspC (stress-responsive transcriptional regulator) [Sphingobacteriales bacterium]|jgi:phage shock protein PspC (stress-responsive transcriptional regulator)